MPDLVRRSSSFLRSSSTRTLGRGWGRVGSLRRGCGGAGQRQLLPPAGTSLGKWTGLPAGVLGGRVMGWGSSLGRAPEAIRNLPGVQPAVVLVWLSRGFSFAGCTPGRTLIGLRLPDWNHP